MATTTDTIPLLLILSFFFFLRATSISSRRALLAGFFLFGDSGLEVCASFWAACAGLLILFARRQPLALDRYLVEFKCALGGKRGWTDFFSSACYILMKIKRREYGSGKMGPSQRLGRTR